MVAADPCNLLAVRALLKATCKAKGWLLLVWLIICTCFKMGLTVDYDQQASTPNTMTPGSTRKSGWGRTRTTKKSRLSTAECTSIVEGLKVIYFGKVHPHMVLVANETCCLPLPWSLFLMIHHASCMSHSPHAAQIRPLEESYKFGAFFSSYLNESDFYAKPSVLLLGQYSTGKHLTPMLL